MKKLHYSCAVILDFALMVGVQAARAPVGAPYESLPVGGRTYHLVINSMA